MSVVIKRRPELGRSQRYEWDHDVIGRRHAFGGFTYTFLGAWVQSVHKRTTRRLHLWRLEHFTAKTWRLP